ncbi:MAG TPA: thermonuclease family protein [Gemmatimonadaceae bacterium]|nr:thermonuclease family protein [Gemmatimonadaceae bacterium]
MKLIVIAAIVVWSTAQTRADSGPAKPLRATVPCTVTHIGDGDTITCREIGRVRLIGIDAPELDQRPYGADALKALEQLIPVGAHIQIERDVEPRDQYDRTLGYAWANGKLVNWLMIRYGWVVLYTVPPNVQYATLFTQAERSARTEHAGVWRASGLACRPSDHRKKKC